MTKSELEQQLAAERKRADDSIEENVRLMNRLAAEREAAIAATQAAIELNEQLAAATEDKRVVMTAHNLHQDKQTLVAALTQIRDDESLTEFEINRIATDALAKLKDQPVQLPMIND